LQDTILRITDYAIESSYLEKIFNMACTSPSKQCWSSNCYWFTWWR